MKILEEERERERELKILDRQGNENIYEQTLYNRIQAYNIVIQMF